MGEISFTMRKVLVVYYSQSGQLLDIAKSVLSTVEQDESTEVTYYNIAPKKDFPFPWTKMEFFNAFPESFNHTPQELKGMSDAKLNEKYDLVVLAYQVWYLSPSIPTNSFLQSPEARNLLQNTPVITLIGCRNMWYKAQEKTAHLIENAGGRLVGNIALVDQHNNFVSGITIVRWMLSGVKKRFLKIFPLPGVAEEDINDAKKHGKTILNALNCADFTNLQAALVEQGAVPVRSILVFIDKRANIFFAKWAKFIAKKGDTIAERKVRLFLFQLYLLIGIWVLSPIIMIFFYLVYPLRYKAIQKEILKIKHTTTR